MNKGFDKKLFNQIEKEQKEALNEYLKEKLKLNFKKQKDSKIVT